MARSSIARGSAVVAAFALAGALVVGCTAGNAAPGSNWTPQPDLTANIDPTPALPGVGIPAPEPNPSAGASGSGSGSASPGPSTTSPATDQSVVATGLNQPTGLVTLPDGTALVGERTTGRVLRVQPTPGHPATLALRLPGVVARGDGGLLDLALSPTFDQDGLVYAYLTTATDNRVVAFTLTGHTSTVITGIPSGATDNAGRIAFDATGALLVGTGDAGQPALATNPASLAGKVLRTNDIGQPTSGNPVAGSRVFASGFRTVDGLCVDPSSGARVVVSAAAGDAVYLVRAGSSYNTSTAAVATLPSSMADAGGCLLASGRLVVATRTGRSLAVGSLSAQGVAGTFTAALAGKWGRLRTVVGGTDGAIWLTTSNRDGQGNPIAVDDRVIRIDPSDLGGSSTL